MLFPHLVCREDRDERRGCRGFFYVRTAVRVLTFYQAHRAYDFESKVAGGFDGLHGGGAGGADIVHNHDARAFFAKAFNALSGAVLFFGLAHKEAVHSAARYNDGYDNGVGTHGKAADGFGLPSEFADFFEEDFASELCTAGIERGGAAVDVVVAGDAGR